MNMIDPADQGNTLPLPVTAPCPHSLKFVGDGVVYTAHLIQDLVGDWQLLRSWGPSQETGRRRRRRRGGAGSTGKETRKTGLCACSLPDFFIQLKPAEHY
ncbi:hypothetical protein [Noviherbaspirillum sedimenti]|uniref:hypothetical protein n=1 Tax=Noviherbaspirillum sedimenti TaxID=2320865 RepID=UPI0011C4423F|nr:hypothetical protein [Noviherbaspirillum sedimenti]